MLIFSGLPASLDASADPDHIGRLYAVVVLEDDARPDTGGELDIPADRLAFP